MSFNTSTRKEDVSLKLRVTNLQNQRGQTQKLEHESKKMEERLRELKMAMSREKEEREAQQAGFWGTGQTGSLGSYAKDVLNKPAKPKGPKTRKVKILKEEPAAPPERNRGPGMMNSIAQRGTSSTGKENKTKGPRCGQCEEKGAQVTCVECGEDYCASCFASFHLRGNLKKHRSVPFGSPGIRTPRGMITPRGHTCDDNNQVNGFKAYCKSFVAQAKIASHVNSNK